MTPGGGGGGAASQDTQVPSASGKGWEWILPGASPGPSAADTGCQPWETEFGFLTSGTVRKEIPAVISH